MHCGNYNEPMFVVRYVALAALVFWVGGLAAAVLDGEPARLRAWALACGGLMLVCLLIMKFVGPPPRGFSLRLTILLAMLALASFSALREAGSLTVSAVNIGLGLVLLGWYARE
jgi:hypothetical protein